MLQDVAYSGITVIYHQCITPSMEVLTDHLKWMRNRFSDRSIETRRAILTPFFEHVKKIPQDVTLVDIENYRNALLVRGKLALANGFCAHIKQLMKWYERFDVSERIVYKRLKSSLPTVLNRDEMLALVKESSKNPLHSTIIMTFMFTGIRLSELAHINLDDIDFGAKNIHIREGKGGKDRMVVLGSELEPVIRMYIEKAKPQGAFFLSERGSRISPRQIQRIVKGCAVSAGIRKNVHPHTLRHSFATMLLANKADIRVIQVMLGHANIASTQIYTHVDSSQIAETYDRCRPRL